MQADGSGRPYRELVVLVDAILDECEDDVPCIIRKLDTLDKEVRNELLISDLLNAYQVFYFMFRTEPDILTRERMELEPASALRGGLLIETTDLLEMYFVIHEKKPVIVIHDGDKTVATFTGKSAYAQGLEFLQGPAWQ
ncbi:MAG TPA: hypothetical protein VHN82_03975 [Methanoregula sp.]|nr:hypothetical protein [Methanoregula sp.]